MQGGMLRIESSTERSTIGGETEIKVGAVAEKFELKLTSNP